MNTRRRGLQPRDLPTNLPRHRHVRISFKTVQPLTCRRDINVVGKMDGRIQQIFGQQRSSFISAVLRNEWGQKIVNRESVHNGPVIVKFKRLRADALMPTKAREDDAAFDLHSIIDYDLRPGEYCVVPTGIVLEIPQGYEGQVRPRSGFAAKNGVTVLNTPGTIDSGYRGEVMVIMVNHGREVFHISKGMRICQLAIRPVPKVQLVECEVLSESDRGTGGFGSTGI